MNTDTNRRNFLKIGTGAAGAIFASGAISKAVAAVCGQTPAQAIGPFYPGETEFDKNNDLTRIPGHNMRAEGQVVYVKGKVLDVQCNPIENANVEIWQACATGKYNNSRDPNTAPLDPHFRYWAETFTDKNGDYLFKTIIPGAYPADTDWIRPPHIHFKITRLGYRELVTQMYFSGNELNDRDLILQQIPASERNSVIVDFKSNDDKELGTLVGNFNITLRSVR